MSEKYCKLNKIITILEMFILIIINIMLKNNWLEGLILILEFMIVRTILGAKHYENRYECFLMTMAVMTSIFLILKISFVLALISTLFAAINLSDSKIPRKSTKKLLEKGFMYKPKGGTKYKLIDDYIETYPNSEELLEFENRLKSCGDGRTYDIYKMRFRERNEYNESLSLENIEAKTGVNQRRIVEKLDNILLSFKVFCNLPTELDKK